MNTYIQEGALVVLLQNGGNKNAENQLSKYFE